MESNSRVYKISFFWVVLVRLLIYLNHHPPFKKEISLPLTSSYLSLFSPLTFITLEHFLQTKSMAFISHHVINTTSQTSSRHLQLPCKCPSLNAFSLQDDSTLVTPVTKLKTSTTFILLPCFAPYLQLAGVPLGRQFLSQQPFPFHVSLLWLKPSEVDPPFFSV